MKLLDGSILTISESWKAPKDHMWLIESILVIDHISSANVILFKNEFRRTRQQVDTMPNINTQDVLFTLHTDGVTGFNFQINNINELTKYLTVGKQSTNDVDITFYVFGKLVKATRTQLLIEWFRKAR